MAVQAVRRGGRRVDGRHEPALTADLRAALERTWPDHLERLRALVRARSVEGNEAAAQAIVASALRSADIEPEVFDVPRSDLERHPGWGPSTASYVGRPNVVGVLRGTGSGRSLILNAHIDSVVAGPRELWDRDPWSADVDGGRLYGRGSWDDKVGVAAILWIVLALRSARTRLRGDLIVQTVIDEEVSGNGTLACMTRGPGADAAIVVDGRGPGSAVVAHCGQLWFRVAVTGKTAAAVDRLTGRNAIELLVPLLRAFRELESRSTVPASAPFDGLEHPVLFNPGVIRGGETPTTVPGTASLDCHLTFPAPWTVEDAKRIVRDVVADVGRAEGWPAETAPAIEFLSLQVPPFVAPPSDDLLSTIDRCQRRELGAPLVRRTISGFGDLRHFQLHGPMPCCLYGAGSGGGAHAANEWLDLATVADAARVLLATVVEWCGPA